MAIWLRIIPIAALLIGSSSAAQELLKVPVQIPAITPAVTAFTVARERGYYRQEGLDAQLIVMPSALGSQALLGGNVKFSTAGGAGLLPILRGAPVRFMFTTSIDRCFGSMRDRTFDPWKTSKEKRSEYPASAAVPTRS